MRISIVIPTLDRREMLEAALKSVEAQHDPDTEVIVVDGGSTDGTHEYLRGLPWVRCLADRRHGLYDAINQGVDACTGDVIGFLNSDDLLPPSAFAAVRKTFQREPETHAVCGSAEVFDETGPLHCFKDPRDIHLDAHAALVGFSILNARFFRRSVLVRLGGFDTSYRVIADRKLLARCVREQVRFAAADALLYRYRSHAGSLTFARGAERGLMLREELLRLAREIVSSPGQPPDLRAKAIALEGRCLGFLAGRLIGNGEVSRGLKFLLSPPRNRGGVPLLSVAKAVLDLPQSHRRRRASARPPPVWHVSPGAGSSLDIHGVIR